MGKFLERHKLSKLSQKEKEYLNRFTTSKQIESVIKNNVKKIPGFDGLALNSIKFLKKN